MLRSTEFAKTFVFWSFIYSPVAVAAVTIAGTRWAYVFLPLLAFYTAFLRHRKKTRSIVLLRQTLRRTEQLVKNRRITQFKADDLKNYHRHIEALEKEQNVPQMQIDHLQNNLNKLEESIMAELFQPIAQLDEAIVCVLTHKKLSTISFRYSSPKEQEATIRKLCEHYAKRLNVPRNSLFNHTMGRRNAKANRFLKAAA